MKKKRNVRTETPAGNPAGKRPAGRSVLQGGLVLPQVGRRFGPLLGLLFLAYPIDALLASGASPARLVFALCGTALFVAVFLWLLWAHEPFGITPTRVSEVRKRRVAVASLAAMASVFTLFFGGEWLTFFVHTGVAAGLMLPGRDTPAAVAGLSVLAVAVGLATGTGWPTVGRFVLTTSLMGLLFAALARYVATVAELREAREEVARLAVAEERSRFARDLHDLLGHSLSLITLKSALAGRLLPVTPETERAAKEVRDVEGVAREALREVREAVAGYRSPTLAGELSGAREMLEAAGISCRIRNEAGALPNAAEAVLAWVVREGTTNVIRHSRAQSCEVQLTRDGDEVRVEVNDDGRGPSPGETTGTGLSGLAERVAASGGSFEAGALPAGGFRLSVSLPLQDVMSPATEPASRTGVARKNGPRCPFVCF